MIQLPQLVQYIRDQLTSFQVAGVASFEAAKDDSRVYVEDSRVIPTLFVIYGGFIADPPATHENIDQTYSEYFSIVSVTANKDDRTGFHGQQGVRAIRLALLRLLYNEDRFDTDSHPIEYVEDKFFDMDRARYWHKFDFKLVGRIDPSDGKEFNLDDFNRMVNTWITDEFPDDNPLAVDDLDNLYGND